MILSIAELQTLPSRLSHFSPEFLAMTSHFQAIVYDAIIIIACGILNTVVQSEVELIFNESA